MLLPDRLTYLGMVLKTIDLNRKLGGYNLISAGPDLCVPLVLFQEASAIHYLLRNLTHLSSQFDHHARESYHQAQPLLSHRSHVELKNLDKIQFLNLDQTLASKS